VSFRRGIVRCNYCKKIIREIPKKDWWLWSDNTQVLSCAACKHDMAEDAAYAEKETSQ